MEQPGFQLVGKSNKVGSQSGQDVLKSEFEEEKSPEFLEMSSRKWASESQPNSSQFLCLQMFS